MSHRASSWLSTIPADQLSASQFRVLFHLCDSHNSQRPSDTACFPSQEFLRKSTGLSNGGLNNALKEIETKGLIRRVRTRNADGTRGPTYYILGFDLPEAQLTPLNGDGENHPDQLQQGGDGPTPFQGTNHLQPTGVEPVIEPGREEEAHAGAREPVPEPVPGSGPESQPFAEDVAALARAMGHPQIVDWPFWRKEAESGEHLSRWRALGLSDARILEVAVTHAASMPDPPRGPKALDRAMERAAGGTKAGGAGARRASTAELIEFWRAALESGRYIAPSAMTTTIRNLLISHGVATHEALRARGL